MRGGGNLTGVSSKLRYHNQFADCVSEAAGAREVSGRREVREGREDDFVLRGSGLRRRKCDHLHGNIATHGYSVAVGGGGESGRMSLWHVLKCMWSGGHWYNAVAMPERFLPVFSKTGVICIAPSAKLLYDEQFWRCLQRSL